MKRTETIDNKQFYRDLLREAFSAEIRKLALLVLGFVGAGTIVYHTVEGWSLVDSYFVSVMTLTTIGYGDLTPQTTFGKLFTTVLVFGGLGIVFTFVQMLAREQAKEPFFYRLINRNKNNEN